MSEDTKKLIDAKIAQYKKEAEFEQEGLIRVEAKIKELQSAVNESHKILLILHGKIEALNDITK